MPEKTAELDWRIGLKTPGLATRIAIGLFTIWAVWGSTYLAIRIGVETLPPFLMAGLRWVIAGSLLMAWVLPRARVRPTLRQWALAAALAVPLIVMSNGGVTWAEQRVASGPAALFVASVSLWMVVFDWALPGGTRPSARVLLGLLLGLAGVAILANVGGSGGHSDPVGVAVLVGASAAFAAGSLLSRTKKLPEDAFLTTGMQMLSGGFLLLLLSGATGEVARLSVAHVAPRGVLALLYLAIFGSLLAFTVYAWLVRVASSALVSTYGCVNPVVAVFLGWAFGGEPLTGRTLAAAAVIVGAVALIVSERGKRAGH